MEKIVSIIVPVYETEKYIEQCLESIIGQTYKNIEIILIVGNGRDRSEEICRLYARKDQRIRMIIQKERGAGSARNQGVASAQGDYICFVDSDDWIDAHYVEKMLKAITENGAELVECDYYWGPNGNERIGGNSPYVLGDINQIVLFGAPSCWKFMYSKESWLREGLRFSNTVAEDLFLFLYAYRVCKPQCILREPLYYYRVRQGSFTETGKVSAEQYIGLFSMFEELIALYKRKGIWERYIEDVYRMFTAHITIRYRAICEVLDDNEKRRLKVQGDSFLRQKFDREVNCFNRRVIAFGSYNLGRISNSFSADNIADIRYGFSSIISVVSGRSEIDAENSNGYRLKMINKDLSKPLIDDIKLKTPDLLLIDLLEERNNIIKCGDSYITASEVFYESVSTSEEYRVLNRIKGECDELWRQSCDRFTEVLNSLDNSCQIILVEMFLSEYIGTIYGRDYNADENVRVINKKLREYYDYFEKKCPRAKIVHNSDIPERFIYTEKGFEHGELPSHYNHYYYDHISNLIYDIIS